VQWAVEAMSDRRGVARVVPDGFEAYVRLLHPLEGDQRWADLAPAYLASGTDPYPYPFPEGVTSAEGDMGPALVDTLVPALTAATTLPDDCHYGLWDGWGDLHPGSHSVMYTRPSRRGPFDAFRSRRAIQRAERVRQRAEAPLYRFVGACPVQPWWGGRNMLLFDGPIGAVTSIGTPWPFDGTLRRRGPQWWWPADRAWFVATEIDYPWTYAGCSSQLADRILSDPTLEAVPVDRSALW
jgi:hypothetical protein